MPLLTRVRTRNYRSLADVTVDVGGVSVLFGHNGSGKSTFLDTLWFLRDCAINGVDVASGRRSHRGSVHFLVNMLEAYYFADAQVLREVLGLVIADHDGDVELIPHPKHELKRLAPGFDEVRDGAEIVARLDLHRVLGNPTTCASLRTLIAWCIRKTGQEGGAGFV